MLEISKLELVKAHLSRRLEGKGVVSSAFAQHLMERYTLETIPKEKKSKKGKKKKK